MVLEEVGSTQPNAGVLAGGTALVKGFNPGAAINSFNGWLGMQFTVGASPLTVTGLGRIYLAGNSHSHVVKLVRASDGTDVLGGSVAIQLPGGTAGSSSTLNWPLR